jgi:hypothetical protein
MQEFIKTIMRATTCLCAVSFALAMDTTIGGGSAWAVPLMPGVFGGGASGGSAHVTAGSVQIPLLQLAAVACPCEGTLGKTHSAQTGPISIPDLLSVALSKATALSDRTDTAAQTEQTAELTQLSLLGGLITADLLKADTSVSATTSKISGSYSGSTLTNLVIAGTPIDPNVSPNTVVPLPGLGSVTVYSVVQRAYLNTRLAITVDMLVIRVLQQNSFGLPVGAVIKLGEARAGFNRDEPLAIVKGDADIASANAAGLKVLPELSLLGHVGIGGCKGSEGVTRNKQFAGLSLPIVSLGVGTVSTYSGPVGKGNFEAQSISNVANVNLLGGLITADGVTSVATETAVGNQVTGSTAGTQFAGLTVLGVNLPLDPPANTKIVIPLLGTLVVNEQTTIGHGRRGVTGVIALHLYTTQTNVFGLPVGAEITIAQAGAAAGVPNP